MAESTALQIRLDVASGRAKQELRSVGSEFGKLGGAAKMLQPAAIAAAAGVAAITAAAVAAGAAVVKFSGEVIDVAEDLNQLAKDARSLGVSVESLDAFAGALGLLTDGGADATKVLARMVRSIGDASTIGGQAADSFEALGLDAESLAQLDTDQQFEAIARALGAVDDEAKQASIGAQIFGRSFQQLRPALAGAGEDFDKAAEQIRQAGVATGAAAAQSEVLVDRIALLSREFVAFRRDVLVPWIPALTGATEAVRQLLRAFGQNDDFEDFNKGVAKLVESQLPNLTFGFVYFSEIAFDALDALDSPMENLINLADAATKALRGDLIGAAAAAAKVIDEVFTIDTDAARNKAYAAAVAVFEAVKQAREATLDVGEDDNKPPNKNNNKNLPPLTLAQPELDAIKVVDEARAEAHHAEVARRQELTTIYQDSLREQQSAALQGIGLVGQFGSAVADAIGANAKRGTQAQKEAARASFVIQKIAAAAEVAVNGAVAISEAAASAPPPLNVPAIAAAVAQTAVAAGIVGATTIGGLAGIADGGLAPGDLARAGFTGRQTMLIDSRRETVLPAGPSQDLMMIAETLASLRAGLQAPVSAAPAGDRGPSALFFNGRRVAEMNRRTRADAYERGVLNMRLERGMA